MSLTKKQRSEMIEKILKSIDDWSRAALIRYVKNGFDRELSRGSDTLVELEYKDHVDPKYEVGA